MKEELEEYLEASEEVLDALLQELLGAPVEQYQQISSNIVKAMVGRNSFRLALESLEEGS